MIDLGAPAPGQPLGNPIGGWALFPGSKTSPCPRIPPFESEPGGGGEGPRPQFSIWFTPILVVLARHTGSLRQFGPELAAVNLGASRRTAGVSSNDRDTDR